MSIKVGEIGKSLYVGTAFNLNEAPFTSLKLNFTSPDGQTKFTRNNVDDNLTAPNTDSPAIDNVGVLPANTYILYKTQELDFSVDGDWKVCAEYQDAAPSKFFGDDTTITIEDSCN